MSASQSSVGFQQNFHMHGSNMQRIIGKNFCLQYLLGKTRRTNSSSRRIERVNRQLFYYQWVPFLMALEAGFFYFPVLLWSKTNRKSGINITAMIEQKEN
uniref:Innexin n=1 Tax=Meloidogyne incognita TaxID=6306 RepID=A0A914NPC7_MELIC